MRLGWCQKITNKGIYTKRSTPGNDTHRTATVYTYTQNESRVQRSNRWFLVLRIKRAKYVGHIETGLTTLKIAAKKLHHFIFGIALSELYLLQQFLAHIYFTKFPITYLFHSLNLHLSNLQFNQSEVWSSQLQCISQYEKSTQQKGYHTILPAVRM